MSKSEGMKIHTFTKKEAKKIAKLTGINVKVIVELSEDLQLMGLLKHVEGREWRLNSGTEWLSLRL